MTEHPTMPLSIFFIIAVVAGFSSCGTAGKGSPTNVSIESSYNQNLQKYVAIHSIVGGIAVGTLICNLKIMRQEVETVWTVSSFTVGNVTNWENFTNISDIWGE